MKLHTNITLTKALISKVLKQPLPYKPMQYSIRASVMGFSLLILTLSPIVCRAAPPAWWTQPGTSIIESQAQPDSKAVATIGQLKNTAVQARKYIENFSSTSSINNYLTRYGFTTAFSGAQAAQAKAEIDAITSEFWNYSTNTPIKNPDVSQFAVLNLGQLKRVAKPYYKWLNSIGYNVQGKIASLGGVSYQDSAAPYYVYPWNPATPLDVNKSFATLGQLKLVFAFDLSDGYLDTDHDGIKNTLDADPLNAAINQPISISITYPSTGSIVE
ncbi:MAG: hypothetical protein SFY80_03715 [Verrucomicrobiota bacterium]|nr:hypothetical protein [Verrucomicrobiota bacterium]